MVDVEADGPIPGDYSMIGIGAIVVEPTLSKTFISKLKPISEFYVQGALDVVGYTREQTLAFPDPKEVIEAFSKWVSSVSNGRPMFISDNNGFDYSFCAWYLHHFTGSNPFGHSSTNLGSLYKGVIRDTFKNFKHLRKTAHTHNPLDDARGNAEALLEIKEKYDLKISLV